MVATQGTHYIKIVLWYNNKIAIMTFKILLFLVIWLVPTYSNHPNRLLIVGRLEKFMKTINWRLCISFGSFDQTYFLSPLKKKKALAIGFQGKLK